MTTNDTTARATFGLCQRSMMITDWLDRKGGYEAELTLWPLSEGATRHRQLHGRLSVSISSGGASLSLRPTADEARELIAALHWAIDTEAEAAIPANALQGTGSASSPEGVVIELVGEGPV